MKCIPGKTTIANCLKCGGRGEKIGFKYPMVQLKCPNCGHVWRTLSAICRRCMTANETPYMSDCPVCAKKAVAG